MVVDSSFVVATLTVEQHTGAASAFIHGRSWTGAVSLSLLNWEVGNVLRMKVKRGLATPADRDQALSIYEQIGFEWDDTGSRIDIMGLTDRHDLTFYDASYLELAIRRGLPLETFDNALRHAAAAEGVAVVP